VAVSAFALKNGPQIEDLRLMLPFHDADDGNFSHVGFRGEATRLHNRFQNSGGSLENYLS